MGRFVALALLAVGCTPIQLDPLDFEPTEEFARTPCRGVQLANPDAESRTYALPVEDGSDVEAVYCNMDDHGGGWSLVAKVFRTEVAGLFSAEPTDFWTAGNAVQAMTNPSVNPNQAPTNAASTRQGVAAIPASVVSATPDAVVWIEVVHANDSENRREWFKPVLDADNLADWFSGRARLEPTPICVDPDVVDCPLSGRISRDNGQDLIVFEEMRVAPSAAEMTWPNDAGDPGRDFDGICTGTYGPASSGAWPDSGVQLDCGHGMRIWIR